MSKRTRRGLGLASVLALTALLFTVVFTLVASTVSGHSLVSRLDAKTRSRHLAEAAVQRAIVKLRTNPAYGTRASDLLTVTLPGDPAGAFGEVRFSGEDFSVNNLTNDEAVVGWRQQPVPAHCAWLLGVGHCAGADSRVHVLVRKAAFPFVVASQGPLLSTGATRVGTLAELPGSDANLLPGDLASNSPRADAVQLGPRSWIGGDLRSVGGVMLSPQATVAGQTLSYGESVALPRIELRQYDPAVNGSPHQTLPVLLGDQTLAGNARCSTDLVVQGSLRLEGATLFVNGDLSVTGGLSGSGLVVVMGKTSVSGGANLESGRHAVLLSGGDVLLHGFGARASSFHGLVYTEGGFSAQQISLVGTFISRGTDKATLLDNVQIVYDPAVGVLSSQTARASGSTLSVSTVSGTLIEEQLGTEVGADVNLYMNDVNVAIDSGADATSGLGSSLEPSQLFNLNDFLGESEPLEVVCWREEL